jgi:hypothetical protein
MSHWWQHDIIDAGKLPLLLCFSAFVLTFACTRGITRLIRAGRGPFKNVSAGGVHLHHSTPGILLLTVGAFAAIGAPPDAPWRELAAIAIGIGTSLVMDEFAMILHLEDVYWSNEGRVSVEMVSLTIACLGFVLVGSAPFGISGLGQAELTVRIGAIAGYCVNGVFVVACILKGKYRTALFGIFVPAVAAVGALRLGRPGSRWAKRFYGPERTATSVERHVRFDARWDPVWDRFSNFIGGAPSQPDPTEPTEPVPPAAPAREG